MMRTTLTTTAIALLALTPEIDVLAQDGHDGEHKQRRARHHLRHDDFGDPQRLVKMMTRHLELDEDQEQAVRNIVDAAQPEIDALRERGRAAREQMHSLDVDNPDYGVELQNLATEIGEVTSAATLLHGRLRADVYAVLTPEQRELAANHRASARDRFRFFRSRRGGDDDEN